MFSLTTILPALFAVITCLEFSRTSAQDARYPCLNNKCQWRCEKYGNSFKCLCPTGYKLHTDNRSCKDPCHDRPCQWKCQPNGNGGFKCLCPAEYRLDKTDNSCKDVCLNNPCEHLCQRVGNSHKCSCRAGYQLDVNGKSCKAADPCLSYPCEHRCKNLGRGRYLCSCPKGKTLNADGRTCQADDVCKNHDCQHICEKDSATQYRCKCASGYTLQSDYRTCKVLDVCSHHNCQYRCEADTSTHFRCTCPRGYKLQHDRRTCKDINECDQSSQRCRSANSECHNTWGYFTCIPSTCPRRYQRKLSKRYCIRNTCKTGDAECLRDITYSYQWLSTNVPNGRGIDAVKLYYELSPPPYRSEIRFVIHSGNEEQMFHLQHRGAFKVLLRNRKKLVGPKKYKIVLHINVYKNGGLFTRLVNVFHVYVSAYSFF